MNTNTARPNLNASPTDIVIAMSGADTVNLSGFAAEAMPPSWFRPGVVYLSAQITSDEVIQEVLGAKRRKKWIERSIWSMLLLAAIAMTLAVSMLREPAPNSGPSATAWHIVAVNADGVTVQSADNTHLIPLGSPLPNGETLLGVSAEKRAYTTQSATVILQGRKQ